MDASKGYKVVLRFTLKPGMADEELRRSREPSSFPNRLARQPGFVGMELVRVTDDETMSVQTWSSAEQWWAALEAVRSSTIDRGDRDDIVLDRSFHAGPVVANVRPVS